MRSNLRKIDLQVQWLKGMMRGSKFCSKHQVVYCKGWSVRGIRSGKCKKLQKTHRIDDGLQHEKSLTPILTSIDVRY